MTLGHMPREVSKVSWFFLGHGGGISREEGRGLQFLKKVWSTLATGLLSRLAHETTIGLVWRCPPLAKNVFREGRATPDYYWV